MSTTFKSMPTVRKIVDSGFTLVELLVVVALIGILAVAVLSTINPIEQTNRARDAKYKNDAAEIVNATERYYTANLKYPWAGSYAATDDFTLVWTDAASQAPEVGICDVTSGCPTAGRLITGQELKNEFAQRAAFDSNASITDKMYIARSGSSSGSTYVCFVPKSNTTRDKSKLTPTTGNNLKQITLGQPIGATNEPAQCPTGTLTWNGATIDTSYCQVCVPGE